MPAISRFYGITIKMFFRKTEHNPPHVHAVYGEYMGEIDIKESKMLVGDLPPKAYSLVKEWVKKHQPELLQIWETGEMKNVEPLK